MIWGNNSKMSSIKEAPISPVQSEPYIFRNEGRCEHLMKKKPQTYCSNVFYYDPKKTFNPVTKKFCMLHRYCFSPVNLNNKNERCMNLRASVFTYYCLQHREMIEDECKEKVSKYKTVCGKTIVPCKSSNGILNNRKILDRTMSCMDKRREYETTCMNESLTSAGHRIQMERLQANVMDCNEILDYKSTNDDNDT